MKYLVVIGIACLSLAMAGVDVPSTTLTKESMASENLRFSFRAEPGPLLLRWDFIGEGSSEEIVMEFTLPSDVYIGLGLGCTTSAKCDMVIGNGGGRNDAFVEDYYEAHGNRAAVADIELGGKSDVTLVSATYKNWASTVTFRRKLNTGDAYDFVLRKERTPIVYAWCQEPFCNDFESPHQPGDWGIINVDLSGNGPKVETSSVPHILFRNGASRSGIDNTNLVCYAGSEALCGCSTLIRLGSVSSMEECTQEAAIEYCVQHGPCES